MSTTRWNRRAWKWWARGTWLASPRICIRKLTEECEAEGYDRMTRKDQLPIQAALSLLAREQMSGEKSPPAAQRILDMWRDTFGDTADLAFAEMNRVTG